MGKRHSKQVSVFPTVVAIEEEKKEGMSPRSFTHTGEDYDTTMDAFVDMVKLSLKKEDVCVLHIRENDKPILKVGPNSYYALDIVKLSKNNGYQVSAIIK